jgi:hypothetical protein
MFRCFQLCDHDADFSICILGIIQPIKELAEINDRHKIDSHFGA